MPVGANVRAETLEVLQPIELPGMKVTRRGRGTHDHFHDGRRQAHDPLHAREELMIERLRGALEAASASVGRPRSFKVSMGYRAVPDFSRAKVDAMEMLLDANNDLRRARSPHSSDGAAAPAAPGTPRR